MPIRVEKIFLKLRLRLNDSTPTRLVLPDSFPIAYNTQMNVDLKSM